MHVHVHALGIAFAVRGALLSSAVACFGTLEAKCTACNYVNGIHCVSTSCGAMLVQGAQRCSSVLRCFVVWLCCPTPSCVFPAVRRWLRSSLAVPSRTVVCSSATCFDMGLGGKICLDIACQEKPRCSYFLPC